MRKRENKTVLLMEASSRQVLPVARAFKQAGYTVTTVCEHNSDLGNVTRFKDYCFIIKEIDSNYEFANEQYKALVKNNKYDIIMPLSDFSARIASCNKEEWKLYGSYVAVNQYETFILAFDKLNTMRICMENDIPCPYTILVEDLEGFDYGLINHYPVVIKPRSACGSIGFHIAENENEVRHYIKQNKYGPLLIQEYIPQTGRQFNAHFLLDNNHFVKTAVCTEKCRWFPIDGGASTLSRTIKNDYIIDICEKLLKTIGWVGYCDIDLMEDPRDGSIKIVEINARISANIKLCFYAGVDVVRQLIELSNGLEVTAFDSYSIDKRLRCIHTDLLWLLKTKHPFSTYPNWFSHKRTIDQIFSYDDVVPFITFSIMSLFRYKREMRKRER